MTAAEMVTNFRLEYDRVASLSAPTLEATEIYAFLNRSQYEIVDRIVQAQKFELLEDLMPTAAFDPANPSSGTTTSIPGSRYIDLTATSLPNMTDYLYPVDVWIEVTRTKVPLITTPEWTKCERINRFDAMKYLTTTTNTPIFRNPKYYVEGDKIVIIPDGYTSFSGCDVHLVYIKKLAAIGVAQDCQLRVSLHEEVVTRAVQLAQIATNPEQAAANIKLTGSE